MSDNTFWVKIETKNSALGKELEAIIRSTEGFRILGSNDTRRADILIFELGSDIENEFRLIQSLLSVDAVGEMFLTSKSSDSAVLLQTIRIGAKEFFSQPLKKEEVQQGLKRFKERSEKSNHKQPVSLGQIIHVMGSKGGVGTTTVAVNLADCLAKNRSVQSVALIDMNLLFGEIPIFLDIKHSYHWGEIIKNISRLDATFLMSILSKHSSGIYVLPSPSSLNSSGAEAPAILESLLYLMQSMFDFIVIDGGQSVDEISFKVLEVSDNVLLISSLSLPCLHNTRKLLKTFDELGYPPQEHVNIVVNRYLKKSDISLKEAEDGLKKKIFWTIPNDYRTTISAINQGKSLSQIASNAPITKNLKELANTLIARGESQEKMRQNFLKR